jgi:uncharacterized membrane protein
MQNDGTANGRGGGVSEIYLWLKWAHVVSSTVLFGMGAGIAFFFIRAQRTGDVRVIAAVGREVVIADAIFTGRNLAVRAMLDGTALPTAYFRYYRGWFYLGWPAFTGVLVVFYLMVVKPAM